MKYQTYKYFKLPITMNPLNYGKLILNLEKVNLRISQINPTNLALILQHEKINHVKIFHKGDFVFEYKDHLIDDNTFM